MTFNPIEEARNKKYSDKELKDLWTGPGYVLERLRKENYPLYVELHAAGEQAGVVGKSLAPNPQPYVKDYKPAPKAYSPSELVARGNHSEQETRAFFADSKKANELFHSDGSAYENWRESGVAFGLFDARKTPYVPAPAVKKEETYILSDELALSSNMPLKSEVTYEQLTQLCSQQVERESAARLASYAKDAADRVKELSELTAKQQADEAVRDQKKRDLSRLAELVMPKKVEPAVDHELAVAKALQAELKAASEATKKAV